MPRGELFSGFNQEAIEDFNRRIEEAMVILDANSEVVQQGSQSEVGLQVAIPESLPKISG